MKVSLVYPKIPDGTNCPLKKCIAFEKLDGTNIHWIFKSNLGWLDFGTRRDRFPINNGGVSKFEKAHPELSGLDKLWDPNSDLEFWLMDNPEYNDHNETIVFTEYWGPNSFAGQHNAQDDKQLTIIDVMVDGKFLSPEKLIKDFSNFGLPKVIYQGKYTGQFVEDVRKGKYPVNEGVVVKGVADDQVYMTKIKTNAYLEKLKLQFKDKWQDYWE